MKLQQKLMPQLYIFPGLGSRFFLVCTVAAEKSKISLKKRLQKTCSKLSTDDHTDVSESGNHELFRGRKAMEQKRKVLFCVKKQQDQNQPNRERQL